MVLKIGTNWDCLGLFGTVWDLFLIFPSVIIKLSKVSAGAESVCFFNVTGPPAPLNEVSQGGHCHSRGWLF